MVSRRSDSTEDSVSFCLETECPDSVYESDYCGKHDDQEKVCFQRRPVVRMVAFEGTDTGRKYLGCGVEGVNCGYVKFVDGDWPGPLKKALLKLWSMVEQCKIEKRQLEDELRHVLQEKAKAVEAMMQIELHTADIVGEYKEKTDEAKKKTDEAKKKLKKMKNYVVQNDNRVMYGVCALVFVVGLLLGGLCRQ